MEKEPNKINEETFISYKALMLTFSSFIMILMSVIASLFYSIENKLDLAITATTIRSIQNTEDIKILQTEVSILKEDKKDKKQSVLFYPSKQPADLPKILKEFYEQKDYDRKD